MKLKVDDARAARMRALLAEGDLAPTATGHLLDDRELMVKTIAERDLQIEQLQMAYAKRGEEICQIAGKALGYPWFKDDQKNFPGATEADGVFVGEHVAASIVEELATAFGRLNGLREIDGEWPKRLLVLADWLDREQDAGRWPGKTREVQEDLRRIAAGYCQLKA